MLFVENAVAQDLAERSIEIVYIQDSVTSSQDDVFTLLRGSKWLTTSYAYLLPMSDIIIILADEEGNGVAVSDGNQFSVKYISGSVSLQEGKLSEVTRALGDGAILEMADGSMWEVPSYDQYDTGYWLPPYSVIITKNELNMINVEKGKKIWVTRVK